MLNAFSGEEGVGGPASGAPDGPAGAPGPLVKGMVAFMLAHEQFPAPELIRLGAAAERAGFDLVATSDHFQPWQANERHAGQAWVTLAALGQRTRNIWMGPTVTCPTLRYNPAVVAEAFASLSLLYPGRIFLGLGSGEALNNTPPPANGLCGASAVTASSRLSRSSANSGWAGR